MDPFLATAVKSITPRLNFDLANGLATKHLAKAEEYINQVFTIVSRGFPEGLHYKGFKRCTPEKKFAETTRRRASFNGSSSNKGVYDISASNFYMTSYFFSYNGVDLKPVNLLLPYCEDGGLITITDSVFSIIPVLADRVISVGLNNVFVRLLRGKIIIHRKSHAVRVGDKIENVKIAWGKIYNDNKKASLFEQTTKAESTLAHYLFCRYGVSETFRRYCGFDLIVGEDEINEMNYPPDKYVIVSSICTPPITILKSPYEIPKVRVAVLKENYNELSQSLIGGLFYIIDHFPTRLKAKYLDNTDLWKILLGNILMSGHIHEGILLEEMTEHVTSLDEYIDPPISEKLSEININVNDFYDLMSVVIGKYSDWVVESGDDINSIYDKEFSVLYFVLLQITSSIFKLYFKLKAGAGKKYSIIELEDIFAAHIRTGAIFKINSGLKCVRSLVYSGDNKCLKATSAIVPQDAMYVGKTGFSVEDPAKQLHVSIAEIGGILSMAKSHPDGRTKLNLFAEMSPTGVVGRHEDLRKMLDETQALLRS